MLTIRQIVSDIREQLSDYYPETETDSLIRILFLHYCNLSQMEIHLRYDEEISSEKATRIQAAKDELKTYRPIQYIIGETEFYGLKFKVTPDVLIPRPETEELVDWIIHEVQTKSSSGIPLSPKILDIGAGSGCIAVSLAAMIPSAEVWAMDISQQALLVTKENAGINNVRLSAVHSDILSDEADQLFSDAFFDIIVSNPPYISQSEKVLMQANVLEYEPHNALFAPGTDPSLFYRRIAKFGTKKLRNSGLIFFEINENFPVETATILEQYGYSNIISRKDINDKWRMISAISHSQ